MNIKSGTGVQIESNQVKQTMPNRRMRRNVQKFQSILNAKKHAHFNEWLEFVKSNQEAGIELHKANMDNRDSYVSERYDQIMESVIKSWKSFGYSDAEIQMLREAYSLINNGYSSTWNIDKKHARSLMKSASQSRNTRLING